MKQFAVISTLVGMISLLSLSANAHTTPLPIAPYEARYSLSWRGIPAGESIHKLQRRHNGEYTFETRTLPNMQMLPYFYHESTRFSWNDKTFIPHNYSYNIKEGHRRKKGAIHFDWHNKTLESKGLKTPWHTALTDGMQDKLTQTLCVRQALKAGSSDLNYYVAEQDKIKNYTFSIQGEERLQTKIGPLQTVRVTHVSRKGARTTLWLAKKWDFLPVKMTQMRQGKVVADGEILTFTPQKT